MQRLPTVLTNPTPLLTWGIVGGVSATLLVAGLALARTASARASSAATPPGPAPNSGPGMRLWLPGWCDIQATNDEAFVSSLASVSAETTGQWPPPTARDEEVVTETLRRAFPACPWPPTDPGWRFHGSKPDDVMTWPNFLASMRLLLEAAFAGDLPWGPQPYSVK